MPSPVDILLSKTAIFTYNGHDADLIARYESHYKIALKKIKKYKIDYYLSPHWYFMFHQTVSSFCIMGICIVSISLDPSIRLPYPVYCKDDLNSSLFSTYTTPPPLWERFSSSSRFVHFSHWNVQILNVSKKIKNEWLVVYVQNFHTFE